MDPLEQGMGLLLSGPDPEPELPAASVTCHAASPRLDVMALGKRDRAIPGSPEEFTPAR
ncbi:hypothetical protein GCM10009790_21440 [Georgenia ruanii]